MNIGFVINDLRTEQPGYTTVRLAQAAHNLGHTAWLITVSDFALDSDDRVRARAVSVPQGKKYKTGEAYLTELRGSRAQRERITVDDLDVLMLRNDPADDSERAWAQTAGIMFGRAALRSGVIVLNDPNGLAQAMNKSYFQLFPEEVRPPTLISRDRADIKEFAKEHGNHIVLKPLQGSGGRSVFLVRPDEVANINQMIDAVARDGYIVAQKYLPAAEQGDMRLFVVNGEPLRHKGKYAAFRRVREGGDLRSNLHAGGKLAEATVDEVALRTAEIVRPKLVQDGMYIVGLDIVGDKLMEINVYSPGGLGSAQKFTGVNFARVVVQDLERKVRYMSYYRRNFDNVELATL